MVIWIVSDVAAVVWCGYVVLNCRHCAYGEIAVCLDVGDGGRKRETFIIHSMDIEEIWLISSEVAGRSVFAK